MDGETVEIDLDDLTIEEVEIFEEITGIPIDELGGAGKPKGKMLRALAYLSKRRTDPSITLEEVGRLRLKVSTGVANSPLDGNGSVK